MAILRDLIAARDAPGIRAFMAQHNLKLDGGRIVPADAGAKATLVERSEFWNQRQQAR